jgi:acyl-CoA hydrolase
LIATNLVPDGATLQLGIGNIPNMVLAELQSHKDLGIHSEMFSDGVVDLVRKGVVTNAKKTVDPGRMVVSFLTGSSDLFDFVHNNSFVEMRDAAYTNDPCVIAKQDHMVAINRAVEVDITGQVCSDSIGKRVYSGFGGQLDFMYGASLAAHGKAIIALHSRTSKGRPRIVPHLQQGAGVVTTRGHADYIVTEYGIASLRGKALRERAQCLIAVAHPEDRPLLLQDARHRKLI